MCCPTYPTTANISACSLFLALEGIAGIPPCIDPIPASEMLPWMVSTTKLRKVTRDIQEKHKPENTKRAYKNKVLEFKQYCKFLSPQGTIPDCEFVTPKRFYDFFFYQCFREKKGRGTRQVAEFNQEEFLQIMEFYGNFPPGGGWPDPSDPVGYDTINTYKSAILSLFLQQRANGEHAIPWESVFTTDCVLLMKMVQNRKARMDRKNFAEKTNSAFAPYACVVEIERIEEALWFKAHAGGVYTAFCWLRHRFVFLFSLRGLLRCESIFNAELSDLWGVHIPKFRDPHGMYALLLQFAEGKTNKGQTLFGRCIRHKNPALCPIGALGFYLMIRFRHTREWDTPPDFTKNSTWFKVKLLISGDTGNTTQCMSNDSYSKGIRDILRQLGLFSKHYVHIGRVLGPKLAEFAEVPAHIIRALGNWEPTTQELRYSEKLPIEGMRALGGFLDGPGTHFNNRTTLIPPKELRDQVFPFVEESLMKVKAKLCKDTKDDPSTAHGFLMLMDELRTIVLQDAAAILIANDGRQEHTIFKEFQVFRCKAFGVFVEDMRRVISSDNNPIDQRFKEALPGMHGVMHNMHADVSELVYRARTTDKRTATMQRHLLSQEDKLEKLKISLAGDFLSIAKHLASGHLDKLALDQPPPEATAAIGLSSPSQFCNVPQTTGAPLKRSETINAVPQCTDVNKRVAAKQKKSELAAKASAFKGCCLPFPPKSLRKLYYMYYGLHEFKGYPIEGGMAMLEMMYKSGWRETKGLRQRQHSRCMMLIRGIQAWSTAQYGGDIERTLDNADKVYVSLGGKASRMEAWLRIENFLPEIRRKT